MSVTWTGWAKLLTLAPLGSVAVRSIALLTSCWPPVGAPGAPVRAMRTVVFWTTAPGGNTTWALPSGSPTDPPPGPISATALFGSGKFARGVAVCVGRDVSVGAAEVVAALCDSGANAGCIPPGWAATLADVANASGVL